MGRGASFLPRLPWKWIAISVIGILVLVAAYYWRRGQRTEETRADILQLLEQPQISTLAERYLGYRERLETFVVRAARAGEPEDWADPRLNIAGLRSGEGLYMRVMLEDARDRERIARSALTMEPDSITRCLGLSPTSVRGLYETGDFLTPEWADAVRREPDLTRLQSRRAELRDKVRTDGPVLASMMDADWFMLVIQRGENRMQHPVDVYLWDLRRNEQLLRARIQARGVLMPVRMQFGGVNNPEPEARPPVRSGAANDCSIAQELRALTGVAPVEIENSPLPRSAGGD